MSDMPTLSIRNLGSQENEEKVDASTKTDSTNSTAPAASSLSLKKPEPTPEAISPVKLSVKSPEPIPAAQAPEPPSNSVNVTASSPTPAASKLSLKKPEPLAPAQDAITNPVEVNSPKASQAPLQAPKKKSKLSLKKPQVTPQPQAQQAELQAPKSGAEQHFNPLFPDATPQLSEEQPHGTVETACPICSAELVPDAVICTSCGFNLKAGKQQKTIQSTHNKLKKNLGYGTQALAFLCIILGFYFLKEFASFAFSKQDANDGLIVDEQTVTKYIQVNLAAFIICICAGFSLLSSGRWFKNIAADTPIRPIGVILRVLAWPLAWASFSSLMAVIHAFMVEDSPFSLERSGIFFGVYFVIYLALRFGSRKTLYYAD